MLDSPPDAPTPDLVLGPTSVDASIQGCLAKSLSVCNKEGGAAPAEYVVFSVAEFAAGTQVPFRKICATLIFLYGAIGKVRTMISLVHCSTNLEPLCR